MYMKTWKKVVLVLGILMLIWGIYDFYYLIHNGMPLLQKYAGTDVESGIRELLKYDFQNGLIKSIISILMVMVSLFRRKR